MSTSSDKPPQSTILVVDDNPENLTVVSSVLRPNYRVRVATEGQKAITIVESNEPPDLILLDVMMPGMDGFEVCQRLKANPARRDIPIVFVTALGEIEDERHGLELGAIDYITKPISPSIVTARVKNHLDLKHAREALARQKAILEIKVQERTADLVRANHDIKESYLETIDLAYAVMSEADDDLGNHCRRVASYARGISERLGFGEEATFQLYVASLLHDLGLVGVHGPELWRLVGLDAPSPTREPAYFSHPVIQMRVLLTSKRFAQTVAIIAGHHENLDGTGFPARARGDAISLESRILAVADRWDVYAQRDRLSQGHETSFEAFVARYAGKLDPAVLGALADLLGAGDPFSRIVEKGHAELSAGMIVARSVRTTTGGILLSAGTTLRKDHAREVTKWAARGEVQLPIYVYRDDS